MMQYEGVHTLKSLMMKEGGVCCCQEEGENVIRSSLNDTTMRNPSESL